MLKDADALPDDDVLAELHERGDCDGRTMAIVASTTDLQTLKFVRLLANK